MIFYLRPSADTSSYMFNLPLPKKSRKVLPKGAKLVRNARGDADCARAGGWRPVRGAGSFVGTVDVGYACSDCAIWVVAAPLLVSRGGRDPCGVKMGRLDGHPELKKLVV